MVQMLGWFRDDAARASYLKRGECVRVFGQILRKELRYKSGRGETAKSSWAHDSIILAMVRANKTRCPMITRRNPVRRIMAHTPETGEKAPGYFLTHDIDRLECAHQLETYAFEAYKKRRGCHDCSSPSLLWSHFHWPKRRRLDGLPVIIPYLWRA